MAIAVLGGTAIAASMLPAFAPAASNDPCSPAYPDFGVGSWPPACWRPYADTSPFNKPIPPNPALHPNSRQIVDHVLSWGPPGNERAGISESGDDFDIPVYWGRPSDPVVTLRGSDPVDGDRIHVPAGARPASGSDAHMTIVTPDGWEYALWHADAPSGGELHVDAGRKLRVDGNGYGTGVVAARWGNLAGRVRAQELQAGQINHALMMFVECTDGAYEWPSVRASGSTCSNRANAPSLGDRFQLAMSEAEIAALAAPNWKKAILRALARYGTYVGELTARWSLLGLESGTGYTSVGFPDQLASFAAAAGIKPTGSVYYFDIQSGVDWRSRLRVVDPSVSRSSPAVAPRSTLRLWRLAVRPRRMGRPGAKRRARIRFRLSEPATVTFALTRARGGRRSRRFVGTGSFTRAGRKGLNRRRLPAHVDGRRLSAGRYRLTAVATDASGARSVPKVAGFRIKQR